MKHHKLLIGLALLGVALTAQFAVAAAMHARKGQPTKFTVRVENISSPDGQTASDGTKWSFALSPGLWVLNDKKAGLFTEGKPASKGVESQAEDGDPSGLVSSLTMSHHASSLHGVFNTPIGMMGPGPIRPGDSYEFTFTASPGMKLWLTMMNGQSNDEFYAPDEKGIALFDTKSAPLSGDITAKLILWDAGTEVNEELGIGPNQGPRQKGMNTGVDEHGVVTRAKSEAIYTKNGELFRVTITPENGM
ncbi:MAG TPA: spondin domain-containing protein [Pyrinomonadaceae bacterium]|nr:spondin domain-containing protein [Pyrinomonadaceae bacterium]